MPVFRPDRSPYVLEYVQVEELSDKVCNGVVANK